MTNGSTFEMWQAARGANLRRFLDPVRADKEELRRYGHEMSAYQVRQIQEKIANGTVNATAKIVPYAWAKFDDLKDDYKTLKRKEAEARGKEAARWKPERLNMELTLANLAVGRAQTAEEVEQAWNAALETGDDHKVRAFAEVTAGVTRKFTQTGTPDRFLANRLSREAERKLEQLKMTPELAEIETRGAEVAQKLIAINDEIREVAGELEPSIGHKLVQILSQLSITNHVNSATGEMVSNVEMVDPPDFGEGGMMVDPSRVTAMTQGG